MRIFLVLIAFLGSILVSLFPFYLAYVIINPNSFFGIVGVFFLGLIIIPLITFIIMAVLGLFGISFEGIKNFLKSGVIKDHNENIQIVNQDSSNDENIQIVNQDSSNDENSNISIIVQVLLICVVCIFFILYVSQNKSNEYEKSENEYSVSSEVIEEASIPEVIEEASIPEVIEEASIPEVIESTDNLSLELDKQDSLPEVTTMKGSCSDVVIPVAFEENLICSDTLKSAYFSDGTVLFTYVLNLGTDGLKVLTFAVDGTKEIHSNDNERIAKVYAVQINSPLQNRNLSAQGVCVYQNPYRNVSALIQCRASTNEGEISATFYTDGSQPIDD